MNIGMLLFTGHNNNETLKLSEEGRFETIELLQPKPLQAEFRINCNHEILEQLFDDDGNVIWMEELGFYETAEHFISKSICSINGYAIQLRIKKSLWGGINQTNNLTSGITLEGLVVTKTEEQQFVLVQETEELLELVYWTVK